MMMSALVVAMVGGACAGDDAPTCPSSDVAGGTFPIHDGSPGVVVVEIEQDGTRLVAGFGWAVPDPDLPKEAFAFIAPDRWLRLRVDPGALVQECRRGGTPDGDCDEIGPPNSGQLVAYRDGVQTRAMALYAPSWPVEPVVEGCPLLFSGHVD